MLDYLMARDQEEVLRTTARRLRFPDGETRRVEAYRLIWSWFDRAIAYEFGPDQDELLGLTIKCAEEEALPLGRALGRVLNYVIERDEARGMDYTDDNVALLLAKRAVTTFHKSKER